MVVLLLTPSPLSPPQRQQLLIAQEMFKESALTREQKALILAFMAGSRGELPPPPIIIIIVFYSIIPMRCPLISSVTLIESVVARNYSYSMVCLYIYIYMPGLKIVIPLAW